MVNSSLERELHLQLQGLRPAAQHRVLEFARALALVEAHPPGVPGKDCFISPDHFRPKKPKR